MRVCRVCGGEPLPPSARRGRLCKSCLSDFNKAWALYYKGRGERPPKAKNRDPDYARLRGEGFAELYAEGKSLRAIAKIEGCSVTTVRLSLIAAGVKLRGKNGLTEEGLRQRDRRRKEAARRYVERGEGLFHIAFVLDVCHTTVHNDLKAEGVELRKRTGAEHPWRKQENQSAADARSRRLGRES